MNKWIFKTVVGMNSQPSVVIGVYYEVDKSYGVVLHFDNFDRWMRIYKRGG